MEDFSLALHRTADGYLVTADCRLVGQATHDLGPAGRETLLGIRDRLSASPPGTIWEAVEIGRRLYGHLLGPTLATHLKNAACNARGLRVLLRLDLDDPLADLPWELLHDGTWPLALNPATPLARYAEIPRAVCEPRVEGRIRVLLTAATAEGAPPLALDDEEARIRASLRAVPRFEIEVERHLSLTRLHQVLRTAERGGRPFHVWHHAGHGAQEPAHAVQLCLEGTECAGAAEVQAVLRDCPSLLMVVLNVCHGAELAGLLANQNLPVAIGFQERIQDRAAVLFAHRLYESILDHPVEVALARSRLSLAYQGNPLLNWTYPRLYTRTTRAVRIAAGHR